MYTLTTNLTSNEWIRIKRAADEQWPGERMSSGEICRRYVLAGVEALKNVPDADRARVQYRYQSTMTVRGPEGDKGGSPTNAAEPADNGSSDDGAGRALQEPGDLSVARGAAHC